MMHYNKNTVDVNFEVMIEDKKTYIAERIYETHKMRYLFLPEIMNLAEKTGLVFVTAYDWLDTSPLSEKSWYGLVILSKKSSVL